MKLFKVVDAEECNRRLFDFGFGEVSEGEVFVADLRNRIVVTFNRIVLTGDGKGVKEITHISTE